MKNWSLKKKIFVGTAAFFAALILFGVAHYLSSDSLSSVSPLHYEDFESDVQQEGPNEETEVLGLASEASVLIRDTDFSSNPAQTQAPTGEPRLSTQEETMDSETSGLDGNAAPTSDPSNGSTDSEDNTSTQQAVSDSDTNSTTPDESSSDSENEPTATPSATPTAISAPTLGIHRLIEYPEPIILKVGESLGILEIDGWQIYLGGDGDALERSTGSDSGVVFTGVKDGSVEIFQQKVEKELTVEALGYVRRSVVVGDACYVHDGQTEWCNGLVQAE